LTITRTIFPERSGTFKMENMPPQIQSIPTGVVMDFTRHLTPNFVTGTRTSTASWINASGTLVQAGLNELRYDFNPLTLQPRGLLLEGARTNSLRNSVAAGSTNGVIGAGGALPTNWTSFRAGGVDIEIVGTGTANGFSYIDIRFVGTATVTGNTAVRFEGTNQVAASSGQTWSASTYVTRIGGSETNLNDQILLISGRDGGGASVESTSVSFAGMSGGLATSRVSVSRTLSNGSTVAIVSNIQIAVTSGNAVDVTYRIAAPQLEAGPFPSSYIPTTGAAAPRAADSAIITDLASIGFNPNEGTIAVEFESVSGAGGLNQPLFSVSDGTVNNRINSFHTSTNNIGNRIITGGVAANSGDVSGINFAVVNKMALAYGIGTNQAISCANGTLGGASSPVSLPSISTYTDGFRIGAQPATFGPQGNGIWIRRLTYYPTRLPNAQLQALTA